MGIDKTLETVGDLKSLAVNAVGLVKAAGRGPLSWPVMFSKVVALASDVQELVVDAPAALPELKDLDAKEAGQVGSAAYDLVKAVLVALAA